MLFFDNSVVVTSLHNCSVAVLGSSFETKVAIMRKISVCCTICFLVHKFGFFFNLLSHCSYYLLTQLVSTKVIPATSTVKVHAQFALHSKDYKSAIFFKAQLPLQR